MMKNGYDIEQINNGWTIRSERDASIHYTLQKETSCNNCQLQCSYCRACVRAYSCTCIDSITHTTLCKHMHILHIILMKDTATPECHTNRDEDNTYFATVLKNINRSSSVFKLQEIRQTKLHEFLALLPSLHNPVNLVKISEQ